MFSLLGSWLDSQNWHAGQSHCLFYWAGHFAFAVKLFHPGIKTGKATKKKLLGAIQGGLAIDNTGTLVRKAAMLRNFQQCFINLISKQNYIIMWSCWYNLYNLVPLGSWGKRNPRNVFVLQPSMSAFRRWTNIKNILNV